jgi:hypothetical protein
VGFERPLKAVSAIVGCSLLLSACSAVWDNSVGFVLGRADPPPAARTEPPPNVKKILADNSVGLFASSAKPRNLIIGSGVRQIRTASGLEYGACLRANLSNAAGKDMGTATYVVTVHDGQVGDRRRAIPSDGCDEEHFEPLMPSP